MDEHEGIISFSVLEAREVGKSRDNKVTHKTEIKFCSDFASMSLSVSVSLCLCLSVVCNNLAKSQVYPFRSFVAKRNQIIS